MSASLEGRLDIRLSPDGQVEIRSTRPQLAQRLLAGRSPVEAAELAGTVFSLCGQAQRAATRAACAAAQGEPPPMLHREVLAELAREHAWRLLLDWPREFGKNVGQTPNPAALPRLMQIGPQADPLAAWIAEHLLGETPESWLQRVDLQAWLAAAPTSTATLFAGLDADPLPQGGRVADAQRRTGEGGARQGALQAPPSPLAPPPLGEGCPFLPHLNALTADQAAVLARQALDTPGFCARPEWQGAPAETGALARQANHPLIADWIARHGRGVGARQLARLLELAQLPQRLREGGEDVIRAWSLADNSGLAGVETSRGLLIHVAKLEAGRIAQYRILAPTEWNFHPAGPLVQALRGLPPGPDLEQRARLAAQALDPCVAYGIEIADA